MISSYYLITFNGHHNYIIKSSKSGNAIIRALKHQIKTTPYDLTEVAISCSYGFSSKEEALNIAAEAFMEIDTELTDD